MNTWLALLPACLAIVAGYVVEEEITVTGEKTIKRTVNSNANTSTQNSGDYSSLVTGNFPSGSSTTNDQEYSSLVTGNFPSGSSTTNDQEYSSLVSNKSPHSNYEIVNQENLATGNFPEGANTLDNGNSNSAPTGSNSNTIDDPFSDSFIDAINQSGTTWQAQRNFQDSDKAYVGDMMGVLKDAARYKPPMLKVYSYLNTNIPNEFDARTAWDNCKTIKEIRDQGSCGSCWAIAAVETMSDRYCIISDGKQNFHLSTEDLISCCTSCGYGCDGGYPGAAWNYWVETGIVSGGNYDSKGDDRGCKPYSVEPCEHHTQGNRQGCTGEVETPQCTKQCQKDYKISYDQDVHYGDNSYSVEGKVDAIQLEILNNGPVEAAYEVYEDFMSYANGVYQHVQGKKVGGHAVKLLGWGVDESTDTPYWWAANSWNTDWGQLGGFFKIKRGTNECNIESDIVAGIPKLDNSTISIANARRGNLVQIGGAPIGTYVYV